LLPERGLVPTSDRTSKTSPILHMILMTPFRPRTPITFDQFNIDKHHKRNDGHNGGRQ